jgi:HNH endonuclease
MATKDFLISKELLSEIFEYKDGLLFYKSTGKEAVCFDNKGYKRAHVNGQVYFVHRIVYMMHHGDLPKFIDHADGNRQNNLISNLRSATSAQNNRNRSISSRNKSGVKGIYWAKPNKKWKVQCTVNYKQHHIGYFKEIEEAKAELHKFRVEHHLEFAKD